ncbi:MAG: DUF3293 domain-containing protein [Chloroflexota bacterium]
MIAELIGFDPTLARDTLRILARQVGTLDAISNGLWSAYDNTVFRATVEGNDIQIRPGTNDPALDRVLEARGVSTWAYITAWNPGSHELSRQENDVRHERLKNDVVSFGLESFEGMGEPDDPKWQPERSLLVLGLHEREALNIGRRYGQNAIVVGETGRDAKLLRCDTDF